MTRDRALAADWLARFEGAGLDGVIAKPEDGTYEPGKRAMIKIKHARTADCVVAGFRWHKSGRGRASARCCSGSTTTRGTLHHVGVTSSFTMAMRKQLARSSRRCANALDDHPWREWAEAAATRWRACPAARAAGARARTCRGSRCGSSASAR